MDKELCRILIVEDSPSDAELISRALVKDGFAYSSELAKSKDELIKAIGKYKPNIILCDYSMPDLDAPRALEIVKEISPGIPFIVVSGTIGENTAVEMMKAGATDYVMKDNLVKLGPAVNRALKEAQECVEHKKAEKVLYDSEEKYRTLVESAFDQIFMVDQDLKFISMNHAALVQLGKELEDVIGKTVSEVFPKETSFNNIENLKKVFKTGQIFFAEEELIFDEKHVFVSTILTPVKDIEGKTTAVLGIARDITERKQMEDDNNVIREKLARSEAMFKDIFDEAADGIVLTDLGSKKFFMANKAFCQMLGYNQAEITNFGVMDIHPKKNMTYAIDQFERQAKGTFGMLQEMSVKRKDGSVFYADINSTTVIIEGKPYQMGLFHDITERREIVSLKKTAKMKKDFIATMSHELRTPLHAVIGFSTILRDESHGMINAEQKEYIDDILMSGRHLLSLINNILDLSKIDAGKETLEISEFDLKSLLLNSIVIVKERSSKHSINISTDIAPDINLIKADERKIKQIMFNLLSNSVKFTPDGGKLGIEAKKNEEGTLITIWDTGIGIAVKDKYKIFDEFSQIDSSNSRKYAGTGLGLVLCKKMVELHGGKIWFESEGKDKGSRFNFTLPPYNPRIFLRVTINNRIEAIGEKRGRLAVFLVRGENLFTPIKKVTQSEDTVLQGEDNEIMVITSIDKEDELLIYARLKETIKKFILENDQEKDMDFSVGYAVYPVDGKNGDELLDKIEHSMSGENEKLLKKKIGIVADEARMVFQ